jgi:hypothetical protein
VGSVLIVLYVAKGMSFWKIPKKLFLLEKTALEPDD